MPWPGEQGTPDELQNLIAKAIRPWMGCHECDGGTMGSQRINNEMSYRATNNLLLALKEAGYELRKSVPPA